MRRRAPIVAAFAALVVLDVAVLVVAPMIGPETIGWRDLTGPPGDARDLARTIFFDLRLPRVLLGMIVGACLALAGALYQAVLRNGLAEPYTLGISGGSALGALLAFKLLMPAAGAAAAASLAGRWAFVLVPIAAFAGAAVCAGLILGLARLRSPSMDVATILLAGVTLNLLCGAGILLIQYLSEPYQVLAMIRWLMGGLAVTRTEPVVLLAATCLPVAAALCFLGRSLDVLNLGEATAHSLGVRVRQTQLLALGGASFVTAFCVAFAGPIGFVGLILPHLVRLVAGSGNRIVLPASALLGAGFLATCDTIGRAALEVGELPVGLVTASLGCPVFIYLLFRRDLVRAGR